MACDSWKAKLDTYLDGELPAEEMRDFDAHLRSCSSCAADALGRLQMKRSIQAAGRRFTPDSDFRLRIQRSVAAKSQPGFSLRWVNLRWLNLQWVLAAALPLVVVASLLAAYFGAQRTRRDQAYGEIADLHVAALASTSRVDVVSSDRHTVKPWFQGKIPFTFNLPDLQNTDFSLVGGRMTYLGQTPGAHLIYEVRKHQISVFIFQEGALKENWGEESGATRKLSFNMETWAQGGLRYCVVGDTAALEIDNLSQLFKRAAGS